MDLKSALQTKHALSKQDLKNAIEAFFKYDLENVLQTEWHLKESKQMFCTVLVLSVGKKRALFKLDLKSPLQIFFKYDLESALQIKWHLKNQKSNDLQRFFVVSVGKKKGAFQIGFEKRVTSIFQI